MRKLLVSEFKRLVWSRTEASPVRRLIWKTGLPRSNTYSWAQSGPASDTVGSYHWTALKGLVVALHGFAPASVCWQSRETKGVNIGAFQTASKLADVWSTATKLRWVYFANLSAFTLKILITFCASLLWHKYFNRSWGPQHSFSGWCILQSVFIIRMHCKMHVLPQY